LLPVIGNLHIVSLEVDAGENLVVENNSHLPDSHMVGVVVARKQAGDVGAFSSQECNHGIGETLQGFVRGVMVHNRYVFGHVHKFVPVLGLFVFCIKFRPTTALKENEREETKESPQVKLGQTLCASSIVELQPIKRESKRKPQPSRKG
jgi:hypothetical protein